MAIKRLELEKQAVSRTSIPEAKRVCVDETSFNEPLTREYAYGKRVEWLLGERTDKPSPYCRAQAKEELGPNGF